jgi:hypothetical protein
MRWKNTGSGQYTVWTTDSNGNYTGNLIGAVSGNSYALESLELAFNQDLSGDANVGLYAASGATLPISFRSIGRGNCSVPPAALYGAAIGLLAALIRIFGPFHAADRRFLSLWKSAAAPRVASHPNFSMRLNRATITPCTHRGSYARTPHEIIRAGNVPLQNQP